MRLLIIIGLIYVAYRVLKSKFAQMGPEKPLGRDVSGAIDDVMVKDPQCGVYFPRRTGVHLSWKGQDLYFCSEACRDRYRQEREAG